MDSTKTMQAVDGFSVCTHALGGDEHQSVLGPCEAPYLLCALPPLYIQFSMPLSSKAPPSATEDEVVKRKRVKAPRVPTFEDVHPFTRWSMCVRVYHKFPRGEVCCWQEEA
uniref:Uncharacterized protein n=1 Tax=Arundo donax TaxID=35708 RepID=A0A0A9CT41_ARUDO